MSYGFSTSMVEDAAPLSRTPPSFAPSSYEFSQMKRTRAGSISGRLRAASDLEDRGIIDKAQKGIMKDLIIAGDPELQAALERYERGDPTDIDVMLRSGALNRKPSVDILEDLDLNFLSMQNSTIKEDYPLEIGDFTFEESFEEYGTYNAEFQFDVDGVATHGFGTIDIVDIPTVGLGMTPPLAFQFQPDLFAAVAADFDMPGSHNSCTPTTASGRPRAWSTCSASGHERKASIDLSKQSPSHSNRSPQKIKQEPPAAVPAAESTSSALALTASTSSGATASTVPSRPTPPQPAASSAPSTARASTTTTVTGGVQYQKVTHTLTTKTPIVSQVTDTKVGDEKRLVGAYSPESRRKRIERYLEKRKRRVWTKKVKYDVRKNFADSRIRVKGRFVKKEDEELLRELMTIT